MEPRSIIQTTYLHLISKKVFPLYHRSGVFRSIGPKPTPGDMAKRKARRFWIWHEFKELFTCCVSKPPETLIDIMAQPDSGRESRLSTMTSGSAESTTTLRECISLGKS